MHSSPLVSFPVSKTGWPISDLTHPLPTSFLFYFSLRSGHRYVCLLSFCSEWFVSVQYTCMYFLNFNFFFNNLVAREVVLRMILEWINGIIVQIYNLYLLGWGMKKVVSAHFQPWSCFLKERQWPRAVLTWTLGVHVVSLVHRTCFLWDRFYTWSGSSCDWPMLPHLLT